MSMYVHVCVGGGRLSGCWLSENRFKIPPSNFPSLTLTQNHPVLTPQSDVTMYGASGLSHNDTATWCANIANYIKSYFYVQKVYLNVCQAFNMFRLKIGSSAGLLLITYFLWVQGCLCYVICKVVLALSMLWNLDTQAHCTLLKPTHTQNAVVEKGEYCEIPYFLEYRCPPTRNDTVRLQHK